MSEDGPKQDTPELAAALDRMVRRAELAAGRLQLELKALAGDPERARAAVEARLEELAAQVAAETDVRELSDEEVEAAFAQLTGEPEPMPADAETDEQLAERMGDAKPPSRRVDGVSHDSGPRDAEWGGSGAPTSPPAPPTLSELMERTLAAALRNLETAAARAEAVGQALDQAGARKRAGTDGAEESE